MRPIDVQRFSWIEPLLIRAVVGRGEWA